MPDTVTIQTSAIRHHLGIAVPQEQVHRAFATRAGLAEWWTTTVEGDDGVGGKLGFLFGGPKRAATMEVTADTPDHVAWRCIEGPDEWVGTTLTFDLHHTDATDGKPEETLVLFTHDGWREPVPFMGHCSTKWGQFLLGLKAQLEGGPSIAFPNDPPISSWG